MVPTKHILVLLALAAAPLFSASKLVYLTETKDDHQIVMADTDGNHAETLTKGPLWHIYPAIESSGRYLAYVEGPDENNLNLLVLDRATRALEQWTEGPGQRLHPRFSGDGRYLAYSTPVGPSGRPQIAILDRVSELKKGPTRIDRRADGIRYVYSPKPRIIKSSLSCHFPVLSSDGSFVVFQRSYDQAGAQGPVAKDIVELNLETGKLKQITPPTGYHLHPALSFDDRWIAFSGAEEKAFNIFLFDRMKPNAQPIRITERRANNLSPAFEPDGSVVFSSNRDGRFQLYRIEASEIRKRTFRERRLVAHEGNNYAPQVSGDLVFGQGKLPPLPEPPRSSFGAVSLGDRVYIVGGHQGREHTYPPQSFLSNVEAFDLKTGQWSNLSPRRYPCHGFGIAGYESPDHHQYIYAFGGFAYSDKHNPHWKSLDVIERYDVSKDRWDTVGHLSHPRSSNVVAAIGDKVYLLAGWNSTPKHNDDADGLFSRDIEVFDMSNETVTLLPEQLPNPLRRALSSVVVGNEIWLIGGIGEGASHFNLLDNVTAYRPDTGTFRELAPLPFATFAPAAGVLDNELFVFGGMFKGPDGYGYVNHIFKFDEKKSWRHTGRYLDGTKAFSQVVPLANDILGILGGHSASGDSDAPIRAFETFKAREL